MNTPTPFYPDNDEGYWSAVVSQGQWAATVPHNPDLAIKAIPNDYGYSSREMTGKWETLQQLFNDGSVLCLTVTGYNKGGLLVDWEGLQGFVPTSQLAEVPMQAAECDRMDCLAGYVQTSIPVKVIELDRLQNRIIFSQRAARWGDCCPDTKLATLRPADVCEGDVSNLCDFGVFVDLGGIDGLIHVSELSWQRVTHPRDILKVGQRLRVYVIDVDHKRRRIALSLKRLQNNPWAAIGARYRPGQIVPGVVTNSVEFGAFVRIEEGVEGLIHISELNQEGGYGPHSRITEGQTLKVRILSVDADNQRMALSLRGLHNTPVAAPHHLEAVPTHDTQS